MHAGTCGWISAGTYVHVRTTIPLPHEALLSYIFPGIQYIAILFPCLCVSWHVGRGSRSAGPIGEGSAALAIP